MLLYYFATCLGLLRLVSARPASSANAEETVYDVLILGGGVAGVTAAEQLAHSGIDNFLLVEGRDELGGRMRSHDFDGTTIEVGCNWIQGTRKGNGPVNPIYKLALEHNLTAVNNNLNDLSFYDENGPTNFRKQFDENLGYLSAMIAAAGTRVDLGQVDLTARAGFSLVGERPKTKYDWVSEYYNFDWEYAQTPEQSSWIGTSLNYNHTYDVDHGGFSDDNLLCVDPRGFKHLIEAEAATFLKPHQTLLSSVVKTIAYDKQGVTVTLASGKVLRSKYAIVTFSIGVLQEEDVTWSPALPHWKREAILSMKMATYTKIFLKFDEVFWQSTEMGLYADPYKRGYYPVWQSLDHPGFLPGSGIYFVTVTGDESERIENMSDAQVKAEVMDVLRKMYPAKPIPEPKGFYFYRWHSDPLYRGSYSDWPPSYYLEHLDNLRDPVENVFFAGEATSLKYYGFLQGAYTEGQTIGQAVAKCVRNKGCNKLQLQEGAEVANRNKPYFSKDE